MAFCGNCGAQINDGAKFCPVCGTVQCAQAAPGQQQQQSAPAQPAGPRTDEEKYRYLAALSYLNIIFMILGLLVGNASNYLRHHANQCVCLIIWNICCGLVCIIPFIGWLVGIVGLIAGFVIMIICIVKALKREYYEIPIFGKIRIIPEV
ncbi:MAG: zinc-ribbon domain-containing protein [Christensenellaceae bacterium]|nr:zinc-ribbon domain-containing protein [Christensenellaceae bacterium]